MARASSLGALLCAYYRTTRMFGWQVVSVNFLLAVVGYSILDHDFSA
jgi:hypothetical protein